MMCHRVTGQKGTTMILFAIILVALLGFSALVVDVGNIMLQKVKIQAAVDAVALASAQDLPDTSKAMATLEQYAELNGISPSDITVTFSNSDNTISVQANRDVEYYFAKIFNQYGTSVTSKAVATKSSIGGAFDYVLFSGSTSATLVLNGSNTLVQGSSHTNKNFVANGSKLKITGACEAVTTITVNGSQIEIYNQVPNASYVEMPDFSETIRLQAEQAGTLYNGSKSYNGSNIDVDSDIYINGSLTINGSRFCGKGCILATGDITFNGSNLNQSSGDAVSIYSKNGNITINGSHAEIDGILYAPNGTITFNGSNQTVNGRVIGNEVRFNGSNQSIIGGTNELNSLPSYGVKLEM